MSSIVKSFASTVKVLYLTKFTILICFCWMHLLFLFSRLTTTPPVTTSTCKKSKSQRSMCITNCEIRTDTSISSVPYLRLPVLMIPTSLSECVHICTVTFFLECTYAQNFSNIFIEWSVSGGWEIIYFYYLYKR